MKLESFIGELDQERIVTAIRAAEARTRGEIRVHASNRAVDDPQREAARQFERLGMTATAERNGVLIYVAPRSQRFAILGDSGIHEKCGPDFWKEVAAAMEQDFREGRFTEGLLKGIVKAGDALATHFPRTAAEDVNELPDQVSED
jgi:uncharacterized membrane protein